MQRSIFYPGAQWRGFDVVQGFRDVLLDIARVSANTLGGLVPVFGGLAPVAFTPPGALIYINPGVLFMPATVDPTAAGSIPQDLETAYQCANMPGTVVPIALTALAAGQSINYLVSARIINQDSIRPGDPQGGLLQFWNATSPINPLVGINGNGATLPTMRAPIVQFAVTPGVPAATGTQATPNAPAGGYIPVALATQNYGDVAITAPNVSYAPNAPHLAGLLNSHHGGVPGQAPKIDLSAEVRNQLPGSGLYPPSGFTYSADTATVYANLIVPAGKFSVWARVWGGGGGGGGGANGQDAAGGGGAGGYAEGFFGVTPGQSIALTIGAKGAAGAPGSNGSAGGASSFGTFCSATGGTGGYGAAVGALGSGGSGGTGVGGHFTSMGGPGLSGATQSGLYFSGTGGAAFATVGTIPGPLSGATGNAAGAASGGSGGNSGGAGGIGGNGLIVVAFL